MNENERFSINIDGKNYSPGNPLIIAELGTSHNGDLIKAKEMISAAAEAGAGCVKFQMVFADEILHPNTGEVPLPGGMIRLYDQFKSLEMPLEFYEEIKKYTENKGVLFLCTPFGLKSASILRSLQPKMVKIASPELNFTSLLEDIAAWEVPVLLSTGVSRLADIENAINIFREEITPRRKDAKVTKEIKQLKGSCGSWLNNVCLLHCVTSYPAPEIDYNLRVLPNLAAIFGVSVGVSDHSLDPELVPSLAISMGACVIEKHFCLSRNDPGLDDPIALEPGDFLKLTKAIRQAARINSDEIIAHYSNERGKDLIQRILGNGVKKLAPSEETNYRLTNRSIHALRDIQKGEKITKQDYAVLRTEKILRPGLEPVWEKEIEGRTAKNFIPSGEGIRFEDI
ncbi:MAG: N-acetylneuraminate synthase family protein [Treponema sp.]|nr:N-acetylneuraminate synthase family protein [Treponema sp.]